MPLPAFLTLARAPEYAVDFFDLIGVMWALGLAVEPEGFGLTVALTGGFFSRGIGPRAIYLTFPSSSVACPSTSLSRS